ncbi:MAG: 2-C-methyl-D-erythritol 4-phosphate cytidylyltransferase [bacterium]
MTERYWAIVPAAGVGRRMGSEIPKQYIQIRGKSILDHTLGKLLSLSEIERVVVAISDQDEYWAESQYANDPRVLVTSGGEERAFSVLNGLVTLSETADANDWVLVHDAVRPCVEPADISRLMTIAGQHAIGGILGAPVTDTIKQVSASTVQTTVDRAALWRAFTPQMFRLGMLRSALRQALSSDLLVTDECSAIEAAGHEPLVVNGQSTNIKITSPEDLKIANMLLIG